jgi:hypothetical protein
MAMVTARHFTLRVVRIAVLVLAFVGARHVLGVWPSSVVLSAAVVWLVVRGLQRLDARPRSVRPVVALDAVYPPRRLASTDRHVAFARALGLVAAAYESDCEREAKQQ